jgi:hypothetical protein
VFNCGIEPNPIFSVFDRFQYQNNSRFFLKIGVRHQALCIRKNNKGEEIILEDVQEPADQKPREKTPPPIIRRILLTVVSLQLKNRSFHQLKTQSPST